MGQAADDSLAAFTKQMMTESDLAMRCLAGNSKAQEQLFLQYADSLLSLARRYLPNHEEAEDILMESFMRIYARMDQFEYRGEGSLKAWMARIVVNNALMHLRKSITFHLGHVVEESGETVGNEALASLQGEEIIAIVQQLPAGYRAIFNLYVIEGYDHEEISRMLGISESTSRSQLFKARTLLKQLLNKNGYQYGT